MTPSRQSALARSPDRLITTSGGTPGPATGSATDPAHLRAATSPGAGDHAGPEPGPGDTPMASAFALLILAFAVILLVRRVEVRLVPLGAGSLLATLASRPLA